MLAVLGQESAQFRAGYSHPGQYPEFRGCAYQVINFLGFESRIVVEQYRNTEVDETTSRSKIAVRWNRLRQQEVRPAFRVGQGGVVVVDLEGMQLCKYFTQSLTDGKEVGVFEGFRREFSKEGAGNQLFYEKSFKAFLLTGPYTCQPAFGLWFLRVGFEGV